MILTTRLGRYSWRQLRRITFHAFFCVARRPRVRSLKKCEKRAEKQLRPIVHDILGWKRLLRFPADILNPEYYADKFLFDFEAAVSIYEIGWGG